jgi:hypothetical protein
MSKPNSPGRIVAKGFLGVAAGLAGIVSYLCLANVDCYLLTLVFLPVLAFTDPAFLAVWTCTGLSCIVVAARGAATMQAVTWRLCIAIIASAPVALLISTAILHHDSAGCVI